MTSPSDRAIDLLRATHDELAAAASDLTDEQLAARSGASEWSVAQVLSHLGSGAEISLATLRAALAGTPGPDSTFTQSVWARWNAMTPRDQASGFLASDGELLAAVEALTPDQRRELQVKLGFVPAPVPLRTYVGMRLNEAALHGWDVRVSLDPAAVIRSDTAAELADLFATDLSFLLSFTTKPSALAHPAAIHVNGSRFAIVIGEGVSVTSSEGTGPTATFTGELEAAIRLLAGRLTAPHTPRDVDVTGNVTLDELRQVFPGY